MRTAISPLIFSFFCSLLASGCLGAYAAGDTYQTVTVAAPSGLTGSPVVALPAVPNTDIPVFEAHHLDRLTEVVAILDIHVAVGGHDAALAILKAKASAAGADAVVGAEFHHGEGAGEPIHVSGMAVRYVELLR